jgi:serine/threonine-protein kinase HipA
LNGKDDKLRRADFKTVATRAGLKAATADEIIDGLIATMKNAVDKLVSVPVLAHHGPDGQAVAGQVLDIVRSRLAGFT